MYGLLVLYDIGMVVAWVVLYNRVGFPRVRHESDVDWREFLLPNLPWFALFIGKGFLWPIPVIMWFANGQPKESAWRAVSEINGRPARRIVRSGAGGLA